MPFSERTPSVYIIRKKRKTWLQNKILSPLQGKKRVKEVVLNQIRKGQYLEAHIQQIWTKTFLKNWSTIGTHFKERWLHPHLLSLYNRTSLLRGMPGVSPQCPPPSWEHGGYLHTTCCWPRSTPQHPAAVGQTHLQPFQSTGRAKSSLLLSKATSLSSNTSYSAQYKKRKLDKIECSNIGRSGSRDFCQPQCTTNTYHILAPSHKCALWYSKIFMSSTTSTLEYCPSVSDSS